MPQSEGCLSPVVSGFPLASMEGAFVKVPRMEAQGLRQWLAASSGYRQSFFCLGNSGSSDHRPKCVREHQKLVFSWLPGKRHPPSHLFAWTLADRSWSLGPPKAAGRLPRVPAGAQLLFFCFFWFVFFLLLFFSSAFFAFFFLGGAGWGGFLFGPLGPLNMFVID